MTRALREIEDGAERWADRRFAAWCDDDDTPEVDAAEPDGDPEPDPESESDEDLCFGGMR